MKKLYSLFILIFLFVFIHAINAQVIFQQVPGSPFTAGSSPTTAAYSPLISNNIFAAISNSAADSVTVYQVDQTSGAFSTPGFFFPTGSNPDWQTYSPLLSSGKLFSAVANFADNTLAVYDVNTNTGAFTLPATTVMTGNQPFSVAFSTIVSGNLFAAVANSTDNNLSIYRVNQTTGSFTPIGIPVPTGQAPFVVAFSPVISGNLFAAVTNNTDGTVSVYQVDQTTGVFTPVPGSPFASGLGACGFAFSPLIDGKLFAAVTNEDAGTISVFQVSSTTGAFTPVPGSPYITGNQPEGIAFSPIINGALIAAVISNLDNKIYVYEVNPNTGEFVQVSEPPVATGTGPKGIAFSPSLSGKLFAATANATDNNTSVYQVTILTPIVSSISPTQGPTSGGTSVIITGANFTGATAVSFGNAAATYTVNSSTQITAISPPGVGTVDVTVTSLSGTSITSPSDQFTYIPPPTVTGINPNAGPTAGGTSVIITGTNLTGATAVKFGNAAATSFTINSNSQITAVSPAGIGTVDITVTTVGGTSITSSADLFTYVPLPTVTALSPSQGPTSGGTSVIITGTHFTGATVVKFGNASATSFVVNSNSQITAISPAGTGTVDVTVTTVGGISATSSADQFTYIPPPVVTSVSPSQGPSSGGTRVTITGENFTGATDVRFGSSAAISFVVNSDSQITAISPPGTGTVDVTVTTPSGTSAISAADRFTYQPLAPIDLKGFQIVNKFATQADIVNIIKWKAPSQDTDIVAYKIYRDKQLRQLLAVISSDQKLEFVEHNRKKGKSYTYYIVSVDQFGNVSEAAKVKIKGKRK